MSRKGFYVQTEFEEWLGLRYYFELFLSIMVTCISVYNIDIVYEEGYILFLGLPIMFSVLGVFLLVIGSILTVEYALFRCTKFIQERKEK